MVRRSVVLMSLVLVSTCGASAWGQVSYDFVPVDNSAGGPTLDGYNTFDWELETDWRMLGGQIRIELSEGHFFQDTFGESDAGFNDARPHDALIEQQPSLEFDTYVSVSGDDPYMVFGSAVNLGSDSEFENGFTIDEHRISASFAAPGGVELLGDRTLGRYSLSDDAIGRGAILLSMHSTTPGPTSYQHYKQTFEIVAGDITWEPIPEDLTRMFVNNNFYWERYPAPPRPPEPNEPVPELSVESEILSPQILSPVELPSKPIIEEREPAIDLESYQILPDIGGGDQSLPDYPREVVNVGHDEPSPQLVQFPNVDVPVLIAWDPPGVLDVGQVFTYWHSAGDPSQIYQVLGSEPPFPGAEEIPGANVKSGNLVNGGIWNPLESEISEVELFEQFVQQGLVIADMQGTAVEIPEPSSLLLGMLAALVGWGWLRSLLTQA